VYSADQVKRLLAAPVELQIHIVAKETCIHALLHALQEKRSDMDRRNAILHADNALELLFKSIILQKGKSYSDELKLPDCVDIMNSSYEYIKPLAGQLRLLHAYRNRVYHHGDTPTDNIINWAVKLLIDIFRELDDFDAVIEVAKMEKGET
jgi:hypothetical protein